MKSMILDCHNHSRFSFDSKELVPAACEQAEALGLQVFALTDHCDMVGGFSREFLRSNISRSVGGIAAWRETHPGNCRMLCGMELGDPLDNRPLAEEILSLAPFDVVIGSVHTDGEMDYYWGDYRAMGQEALEESLGRYFERILEMAEWGQFDVLAHLTYPLRYIVGDAGREVGLSRFAGTIDQIFRTIIQKGIALEANTSGLRQKIGKTLPGKALLERYFALGGRLVTLGSDAHRKEDIGSGIEAGEALLREIGFTEVCWFEGRKLRKIPLASSLSGENPV